MSPNALEHHFHSRANLFAEALAHIRERDRELLAKDLPMAVDPVQPEVVLDALWEQFSAPSARLGAIVFFETWALGLRDPARAPGFSEYVITDWLEILTAVASRTNIPPERREEIATLCLAAVRGLLLDLTTMGEESRQRVDAAVDELRAFIQWVSSSPS